MSEAIGELLLRLSWWKFSNPGQYQRQKYLVEKPIEPNKEQDLFTDKRQVQTALFLKQARFF